MASLPRPEIDHAFSQIEEAILPSISTMLDSLIDAASLAQPGFDAEAYAADLRSMASQLEAITRQMEAISPALARQDERGASAA
ncbi:MAG TPA: hypothetical protein VF662_02925 [Allosphingosinicella sp.]|jgi:hypothetical protein